MCKCTMRQQLVGDGCDECNPEMAEYYKEQTLHEYCAEQMMKTFLATMSGWTYKDVLAKFQEQYPDEVEFRKAMVEMTEQANIGMGTKHSWVDDYDKRQGNV